MKSKTKTIALAITRRSNLVAIKMTSTLTKKKTILRNKLAMIASLNLLDLLLI